MTTPTPAFTKSEAVIIRRFARSRMQSCPAGAALAIHASYLPEHPGSSAVGNGGHGYLLMAADVVRTFLGIDHAWKNGPGIAAINLFFDDLRMTLAGKCTDTYFASIFMSVDCSIHRVSRNRSDVLASLFSDSNQDLMAKARSHAAILGAAPVVPDMTGSSSVDDAQSGKEKGMSDVPTMVVCPDLKAPPPIDGFSEAMQPSVREWIGLKEPLPLHGGWIAGTSGHEGLEQLRRDIPWMSDVVDRVEERLWLLKSVGRNWITIPTLLIYGPSGIGKSYFARRLASALGLRFAETSLAGSTDNREMEGTARGWTNARPSWPVCTIASLGSANPLLFVDEVDKVDSNRNGDPLRTMLTMLDRDTARRYPDKGLAAPCDISRVSWLLAANEVQLLGTAFRDRIEVVTVKGPEMEHLGGVVENVIRDLAQALEVDREMLPSMGDLGMRRVEDLYASRRSLRGIASHVHGEVARMARLSSTSHELRSASA